MTRTIAIITAALALATYIAPSFADNPIDPSGILFATTKPSERFKDKKPGEDIPWRDEQDGDTDQLEILPGSGWGDFVLGTTAQKLIEFFGKPDRDSTPNLLKWSKEKISCLIDENGVVFELRFEKGFDDALDSGIKLGSTEKEVVEAYGNPANVQSQRGPRGLIKRATYPAKGLIFWTENDKVAMIVLLAPVEEQKAPPAGEGMENR